jgi:hypothetical protein
MVGHNRIGNGDDILPRTRFIEDKKNGLEDVIGRLLGPRGSIYLMSHNIKLVRKWLGHRSTASSHPTVLRPNWINRPP